MNTIVEELKSQPSNATHNVAMKTFLKKYL